jgi:hypothetical protein
MNNIQERTQVFFGKKKHEVEVSMLILGLDNVMFNMGARG